MTEQELRYYYALLFAEEPEQEYEFTDEELEGALAVLSAPLPARLTGVLNGKHIANRSADG